MLADEVPRAADLARGHVHPMVVTADPAARDLVTADAGAARARGAARRDRRGGCVRTRRPVARRADRATRRQSRPAWSRPRAQPPRGRLATAAGDLSRVARLDRARAGRRTGGAFLAKGRVALGRGLDYGAPGAGDVRVNFATSPEHLSGAVSRMARAVAAVTTLAEHVHRRLRVGGRRLGASRRVSHGLEQVARDSVRAQPPPWEPRPPQARGGAEHQRRRGSHTSRVARGERSVDNLPIRNQAVNADR